MRQYAFDRTCDISLFDEYELGEHRNHLLFFDAQVELVPCIIGECRAVLKVNVQPTHSLRSRWRFTIKKHVIRYHEHVYRDSIYYWSIMQLMLRESNQPMQLLTV